MPRPGGEVRQRARKLRAEGWPLRRIAHEVGAALSTVSLWVRDVEWGVASAVSARHSDTGVSKDAGFGPLCRCGRCKRELPLTSFNRDADGRQWWCRDCYRTYFRSRGDLHRRQTKAARARRRREARAYIQEYLTARRCCDCGEEDVVVLEFDHLGEKRWNVAVLVQEGPSPRRLQQELAKCEVVCVNCHRVRTAERGRSWRLEPRQLDTDPRLTPGERRNVKYLRELLTRSSCFDCGDSRLIVLDFDHVGTETGTVTELARRGCSLSRLQDEISACEIRCSNCHRRQTHLRLRSEIASVSVDPR